MPQTLSLKLEGLSCGHCVKRVQDALEKREDVLHATVTQTDAVIVSEASPQALIATIEQAGYHAVEKQSATAPKPEPLTDTEQRPEALAADSQRLLAGQSDTLFLLINGMSCASCVARVERALAQVAGVEQAQVNLAQRSALITGSPSPQALINAVKQAGYEAEQIINESERLQKQHAQARQAIRRFSWQSALALAAGIPLMIYGFFSDNMTITADNRHGWLIVGIITLLIIIIAGGHFYRHAFRALRNGSATMDSLVTLGTAAAWLYSISVTLWPEHFPPAARHLYYEASVMIIGLINLGHALEQRARQRASRALERLLNLAPANARVVTGNAEQTLPLSKVTTGMTLRLVSGDRVPVDGRITDGEAWLDEAMLTGEPLALQKSIGDHVFAGTLVQDGSILFTASATGKNTALARIIHLVRQAQSSKPAIGRQADRLSAIFVPAVVLIALISAAIWFFAGPTPQIAYTLVIATTVLIIACPCALGLATPMSVVAGTGRAAELGILVRDADALQRASQLDTLVFDKTGTLTEGKPQLTDIHLLNNHSQQAVLRLAAALEQGCSHPLAKAILARADTSALPEVTQFRTLRGLGLCGHIEGKTVLLGNQALMRQYHIATDNSEMVMHHFAKEGATPVLLAIDGILEAILAIRDPLPQNSVDALRRLHRRGYKLLMLTGDNAVTANAIARQAGLDEVIAGVLPDEKANVIATLQQQGHCVAMIGDGINDAPALAKADVGIAMGGGSDIAIESAAMTLMRHDLNGVADALAMANATLRNMRQNLLGAFIYNLLGIPVAAGILYPLTGTLLSPVIAGAAMALSSVTVVSNANRLLFYRPPVN